jgi:hypothetical protein
MISTPNGLAKAAPGAGNEETLYAGSSIMRGVSMTMAAPGPSDEELCVDEAYNPKNFVCAPIELRELAVTLEPSPFGLFAVGLFGLTFIFSLWRTGSLWWAIGAHTSWNWAQSFLYGVGDSGNMIRYHLLASHPIGQPLLSGGTTGPEGSIFVLPTLALLAVAAFFAVSRTHRSHSANPASAATKID